MVECDMRCDLSGYLPPFSVHYRNVVDPFISCLVQRRAVHAIPPHFASSSMDDLSGPPPIFMVRQLTLSLTVPGFGDTRGVG